MPVPVPRLTKSLAHPVLKQQHRSGDTDHITSFQNLTRTLPVSPTGRPPAFGTREQWINSLPSWRRTKPRRIWEDDSRFAEGRDGQGFQQGLIVAANASVIKGARAQACIPPLFTLLQDTQFPPDVSPATPLPQGCDGNVDDDMSSDFSIMDQGQYDNESQWSASSPVGPEDSMDVEGQLGFSWEQTIPPVGYDEQLCERGAFSPTFENESLGVHDVASSPMEPEPITPFGEFVDRAVAGDAFAGPDIGYASVGPAPGSHYGYHDKFCGPQCYIAQPYVQPIEQVKEARAPPPVPEPATTQSAATTAYKRLAEPLADWVAQYVWKVCTTGTNSSPTFSQSTGASATQYPSAPPGYLSASIHSLLLSTLLQPSAVFLAVWYIVRLPVSFGSLTADHGKELRFRVELLGDSRGDREAMEASAPFRLVLLGCMLANKWLDDHTFSNKTWHSISNVPIHSLNKLESLALEIFSYDLSIPAPTWSRWLSDVLQYHLSLSSPSYPQPISRPSTNPHSIVRLAIEELIQAPAVCDHTPSSRPEPVFLGLDERRKEKSRKEQALAETCVDVLEIDLDEDGPLREEYLPKRRVSSTGSVRSCNSADNLAPRFSIDKVQRRSFEMMKCLPPPAKWSPSGDEPILRERNRLSGRYVAVQPPRLSSTATSSPQYHPQMHNIGYQNWPSADGYVVKQPSRMSYPYDAEPHPARPTYNPYPFVLPIASHSRSHSSYDPDNSQLHTRSYAQSRVEYRCSDIRVTANELGPVHRADARWSMAPYGYTPYSHAYTPHPTLNLQSTWLRA